MSRRLLAAVVLLAAVNPLWSQAPNSDVKAMPPTAEDLKALTERVAQLEQKVKRNQENSDQQMEASIGPMKRDIAEMREALLAIRRDLDERRNGRTEAARKYSDWRDMERDMVEMRDMVRQLRRDVDDLRRPAANMAPNTTYRYPDNTARKFTDGDGQSATVRLANEHPVLWMDAVVNGERHAVPPGSTVNVPVAAGRVNIQVLQTDAYVRSRDLVPGEVRIVTMR